MNPLTWRPVGELPTETGRYWFRFEGREWIEQVFVREDYGGLCSFDLDMSTWPVSDLCQRFQWAGPIPKPVELGANTDADLVPPDECTALFDSNVNARIWRREDGEWRWVARDLMTGGAFAFGGDDRKEFVVQEVLRIMDEVARKAGGAKI